MFVYLGRVWLYTKSMIHRLGSPVLPTLDALRQRLAPQQQPLLDRLGPVDQVHLLGSLKAAEASPSQVYFDAAADASNKSAYYGDLVTQAKDLKPEELYHQLNGILTSSHKTPLDYDPSHHLYPLVDLRPDGKVHSIYAGEGSRGVPAQELIIDDTSRAAAGDSHVNCEHVVPQSWFNKQSPMRGDLHHLFACDIECNSLRANSLYIDFPQEVEGDCGLSSANHSHFEPAAGKGAVARATLYFMLRYPGQIGDSKNEYSAADIQMLLQWHRQDPPAEFEFHRNAEIANKQGNRNPLIDFPEWAERIDFTAGLGRVGRSQTQATAIPEEYLLSCPIRQPFAQFA